MFKIYAEKDGVIISYNEQLKNFFAMVNGKKYSVYSCRPLDGDGRSLREDNRQLISELLPIARTNKENEEAEEENRINALIEAKIQTQQPQAFSPVEPIEPKQKSFAEALEESFLKTLATTQAENLVEKILPEVREKITSEYGILPQIIRIEEEGKQPKQLAGVFHEEFNDMIQDINKGFALYLVGPAGTGKSFIAQQIAEALDLEYYCANAVTDTITLTGFMDANSRYNETEFYKAFVNGGIFLLDELDASIPEVLTLLNNCLANKVFPFPCGKVKAHKDFHVIATGNTYGTGGNDIYTGRFQLDAATLDRFCVYEVNYDERIENNISENDTELLNFIYAFRKATEKAGINCLATYRAIDRLHKMSGYKTKDKAIKQGLTKGLPVDDCKIIYNNMNDCYNNGWKEAFYKLTVE